MNVSLCKAGLQDAGTIHAMQVVAFMPLLEKYQDFETSPANESVERIIARIEQSFTDYYLIKNHEDIVGAVRVVKKDNKNYRISPIFIIPEHQGKGIAQQVFSLLEQLYSDATSWKLDTVMQEAGHCYLYEKLGYARTGETKAINEKMTLVFYEKKLEDITA
ncbi:GNAT family N-acetyltransferase [Paenibacillus glycanilyticus]|uniref:Acetyltransferase n=1 Tax=Paenibacillus glycanilyticus TaxID=126569 RepID=A0ABQ6G8F3_9BACL|nr:GNAT family N-acetyltransferase [Paenibacillus glycanilyticus]GLX66765.1 acetyltransferase [Paenibacillus glycanilyticus]